jgi:hypothetical protein
VDYSLDGSFGPAFYSVVKGRCKCHSKRPAFLGMVSSNLRAQRLLRSRQYMPLQRFRAQAATRCGGREITAIAGLAGVPRKEPCSQFGTKVIEIAAPPVSENEKSGVKIFQPKTAFACFSGKSDNPARGSKNLLFFSELFLRKLTETPAPERAKTGEQAETI